MPTENYVAGIPVKLGVVVSRESDEARGHEQTLCVDDFPGFAHLEAADLGNAPGTDADILAESWETGDVNDGPVFNDGVVVGHVAFTVRCCRIRLAGIASSEVQRKSS